mmetsp:Transcript_54133/g.127216  ORF Transcript_54133/g.127216 Transcript_54133/m.127216 type:complete len:231 (-) Transcript_54133:706-1398(-)
MMLVNMPPIFLEILGAHEGHRQTFTAVLEPKPRTALRTRVPVALATKPADVIAMGSVPVLVSVVPVSNLVMRSKQGVHSANVSKAVRGHHVLQHAQPLVRIGASIRALHDLDRIKVGSMQPARVEPSIVKHLRVLWCDLRDEDFVWIVRLDLKGQLLQQPPRHVVHGVEPQAVHPVLFNASPARLLEVVLHLGLVKGKALPPRRILLALEIDSSTVVGAKAVPIPQNVHL